MGDSAAVSTCVYLDYNATTPIDPRAAEEMIRYISGGTAGLFGNPSSLHVFGKAPKAAIAIARQQMASLIQSDPSEILICSGGTESINHVVKASVLCPERRADGRLPHIVTTTIEHVAMLETVRWCVKSGFATATWVDVDSSGVVSVEAVLRAVQPNTVLVSVMLANNETGALQPVKQIATAVKLLPNAAEIMVHTDASQFLGKLAVDVTQLQVDALSFAGHKIYAPKGIGFTYLRTGVYLDSYLHGASQEAGRRAGTENVVLAAGLGKACELAAAGLPAETMRLRSLRNHLLDRLMEHNKSSGMPALVVHGPLGTAGTVADGADDLSLPNTLSIAFPGAFAAKVVGLLASTVAVSAGAACHASAIGDPFKASISHVLAAMKVPRALALATLRLSVGRWTSEAELDTAAVAIIDAVRSSREIYAASLAEIATEDEPRRAARDLMPTNPVFLQDTYLYSLHTTCLAVCAVSKGGALVASGSVIGPGLAGFEWALILAASIAHPQGGGQPADRGIIHFPALAIVFEFFNVRPASGEAAGCILHYGRFVRLSSSRDLEHDADLVGPEPSSTSLFGEIVPEVLVVKKVSKNVTEAAAIILLNRPHRQMAARLHSAGHLLDLAVTRVYAKLSAAGTALDPLVPGKGYHFEDGPNVEYIGSVPAEHRDKIVDLLNAECATLVSANLPTVVVDVPQEPDALNAYKLTLDDCKHLAPAKPVRVVMVGSDENPCPCGGTHVGASGQLEGLIIKKLAVKKGITKISYVVSGATGRSPE